MYILAIQDGHGDGINEIAVDDRYIYSGSDDKTVRVWDKLSFKEVAILQGHSDSVNAVASDDRYIYTGSSDNTIRVWDKISFNELMILKGHSDSVKAVTFDDRYIYSGSEDKTIRVWNKVTFRKVAILKGHSSSVNAVASDDLYIYSGSDDRTVRVWDKYSFKKVATLKGHSSAVYTMASDDQYIYSGSYDRTVRIWDKFSFKEIAILYGHSDSVKAMSSDDQYIYSGSYDRTVRIWDKSSFKEIATLKGHSYSVNAVASDDQYIYSGSYNKNIRIWDKFSFKEIATLKGHSSTVYAVTFDDQYIYSGSDDNIVRIWDKSSFKEIAILKGHSSRVYAVASDSRYIYSGSFDRTVRVWDKSSFKEIATLKGHLSTVYAVASDSRYIYSGSSDNTVHVWDKSSFKKVAILHGHSYSVNAVASDDQYIYSGSRDKTVRIWDKSSFKKVATLQGHSDSVNAVASDDQYIYSGSRDKTVRIWDKSFFYKVATLQGHSDSVNAVASDDQYIYSGSRDKTVRIWDKSSFKEVATLQGHSDSVNAVASDDQYIYSGSSDTTIRIYNKIDFKHEMILLNGTGFDYSIFTRFGVKIVGNISNNLIGEFDNTNERYREILEIIEKGDIIPVKIIKSGFRIDLDVMNDINHELNRYKEKIIKKERGRREMNVEGGVARGMVPILRIKTKEYVMEKVDESRGIKRIIRKEQEQFKCLKVLLIGHGNRGKTTLLNRLKKDEFKGSSYNETIGLDCVEVDIKKMESKVYWSETIKSEIDKSRFPLKAIFYDFGGQYKYHYAHQFFFTQQSLILIVSNIREGNWSLEIEYWIEFLKDTIGLKKVKIGIILTNYQENSLILERIKDFKDIIREKINGLSNNIFFINSIGKSGNAIGYGSGIGYICKIGLVDWITKQVLEMPVITYGRVMTYLNTQIEKIIENYNINVITLNELNNLLKRITENDSNRENWNLEDLKNLLEKLNSMGKIIYYEFEDEDRCKLDKTLEPLIILMPDWFNKYIYYFRYDQMEYSLGLSNKRNLFKMIEQSYMCHFEQLQGKSLSEEFKENFYEYIFTLFSIYKVIVNVGGDTYLVIDAIKNSLIQKDEVIKEDLEELDNEYNEIRVSWKEYIIGIYNTIFHDISSMGQLKHVWTEKIVENKNLIKKVYTFYKIGNESVIMEVWEKYLSISEIPVEQGLTLKIYSDYENMINIYENLIKVIINRKFKIKKPEIKTIINKKGNKKISPNIMEKLNDILDFTQRIKNGVIRVSDKIDKVHDKTKSINEKIDILMGQFKIIFDIIIEKLNRLLKKCPKLITFEIVKKRGWARLKVWNRKYNVNFYCEKCYQKYSIEIQMTKKWAIGLIAAFNIIGKIISWFQISIDKIISTRTLPDKISAFLSDIDAFMNELDEIRHEIKKVKSECVTEKFVNKIPSEDSDIEIINKIDEKVAEFEKVMNSELSEEQKEYLCKIINDHDRLSKWRNFLTLDGKENIHVCKNGCRETVFHK
ncbi:MAG: ADP-ribosylation factor-like protein [Candidatus Helarchaeota archaeon]